MEAHDYKEQFQTLYRGHGSDGQTRAEFLHCELRTLREEGFFPMECTPYAGRSGKPMTVLQRFLYEANIRRPVGGYYPLIPYTSWSLDPEHSRNTRVLAWRLGVSCYLCGKVSRAREAFTNNWEVAQVWDLSGRGYPSRYRLPHGWWKHNGREEGDVYLSPLCSDCMSPDACRPISKMFREMREKLGEVA